MFSYFYTTDAVWPDLHPYRIYALYPISLEMQHLWYMFVFVHMMRVLELILGRDAIKDDSALC